MHRKVFDSGKQRAANSDIPYNDIKKVIKEKEKVKFFEIVIVYIKNLAWRNFSTSSHALA